MTFAQNKGSIYFYPAINVVAMDYYINYGEPYNELLTVAALKCSTKNKDYVNVITPTILYHGESIDIRVTDPSIYQHYVTDLYNFRVFENGMGFSFGKLPIDMDISNNLSEENDEGRYEGLEVYCSHNDNTHAEHEFPEIPYRQLPILRSDEIRRTGTRYSPITINPNTDEDMGEFLTIELSLPPSFFQPVPFADVASDNVKVRMHVPIRPLPAYNLHTRKMYLPSIHPSSTMPIGYFGAISNDGAYHPISHEWMPNPIGFSIDSPDKGFSYYWTMDLTKESDWLEIYIDPEREIFSVRMTDKPVWKEKLQAEYIDTSISIGEMFNSDSPIMDMTTPDPHDIVDPNERIIILESILRW